MNKKLGLMVGAAIMAMSAQAVMAADICKDVTRAEFEAAANTAATETDAFGFGLPMWATLVDTSGRICHVYSTDSGSANTGAGAGNNAWLGSRVISAQKANTANAFSLNGLSLSTGFVYATVVPGGSLYGLQHSNPVDASRAYGGSPNSYGSNSDYLKNKRIGGVNVFGGGVALYDGNGKVGAIGASGDTSCRDHAFAYRMRIALGYNNQPNDDGLTLVASPAGLGEHPICGVDDPTTSAWNDGASDFGVRAAP